MLVLIEHYAQERHVFQLATSLTDKYTVRACDESTSIDAPG
jgi:hypothetical protein